MLSYISRSSHFFAFSSIYLVGFATPVFSQNFVSNLNSGFAHGFNYADRPGVIQFSDWISLLTLCFAPLIAHIVAGVPHPVYLSLRRVRWHDWICIYNPTSILWRYLAITDRRIRHKAWIATDMASSNAYFWTSDGWDGSEEIMARSRPLCTKAPEGCRTALISSASIQTIIIAAQGAQAIHTLVTGIMAASGIGNQNYGVSIALDSIFSPLAVFGLLRLFAALWLTDDYFYADRSETSEVPLQHILGKTDQGDRASPGQEQNEHNNSGTSLLDSSYMSPEDLLHPQNYWRAIVLRIIYMVPLCGLFVVCIFNLVPTLGISIGNFSHATLVLITFYTFFLLVSILIFAFYIFLGKTATTVIPCMNSSLYKAYTCLVFMMAIASIITAGVYTRKAACGKYTTFAEEYDQYICNGARVSVNSWDGFSGVATESTINGTQYIGYVGLDGWCSGVLNDTVFHIAL